jgi:hypothetical protein
MFTSRVAIVAAHRISRRPLTASLYREICADDDCALPPLSTVDRAVGCRMEKNANTLVKSGVRDGHLSRLAASVSIFLV